MPLLFIVFGLAIWIYIYWNGVRNYWAKRGVPYAPLHPILGSLTFLQQQNPVQITSDFKSLPISVTLQIYLNYRSISTLFFNYLVIVGLIGNRSIGNRFEFQVMNKGLSSVDDFLCIR